MSTPPAPASTDEVLVSDEELASALAYGLRYGHRGKPNRTAAEITAGVTSERLVEYLRLCGYRITRPRNGAPPHTAG